MNSLMYTLLEKKEGKMRYLNCFSLALKLIWSFSFQTYDVKHWFIFGKGNHKIIAKENTTGISVKCWAASGEYLHS